MHYIFSIDIFNKASHLLPPPSYLLPPPLAHTPGPSYHLVAPLGPSSCLLTWLLDCQYGGLMPQVILY